MAKNSLPPGFRFHPTDVELVWYYLKRKIMGNPFSAEVISEVDLYKFAPWDLPEKSCLRSKDLEWFFFCPRDRKYSHGSRTNRATDIGFWKTTGRDRSVVHNSQTVGMKKTLIFHLGKTPHGSRTDWVMYEFRLESIELVNAGYTQDAYVLCKIFHKSGPGPKNGVQYGAPFNEEEWEDDTDVVHGGSFPCIPCLELSHLFDPVPLSSGAPEVGESSTLQGISEVGEPSSKLDHSEVGGLSSMPGLSEVGEPSSMPECPDPYADGILLAQLEELLNSFPPHSENANDELLYSAILHEDVNQAPDVHTEGVFSDLADLSGQTITEPTVGTILSYSMDWDCELEALLSEFAYENYMELSDLGFLNEGRYPSESVAHDETTSPFALPYSSSPGLGNVYIDGAVTTTMVTEPQQRVPVSSIYQWPSTSEEVPLYQQQDNHVP